VGPVFLALAAVLASTWLGVRLGGPADEPPPPTDRPIEALDRGYASSRECAACHPGEHATWHRSYHRSMTQLATTDAVVGAFDGSELALDGSRYRVERRGDEFWVRKQLGQGRFADVRVAMTTGSHHFQCYWMPSGRTRRLKLFDFCYQIAEQRWIPFRAVVLAAPNFNRLTGLMEAPWNDNCSRCHSVAPQPKVRSPGDMDTRAAEFGIACEACHGPGERHVERNRDPLYRYRSYLRGKGDPTIVNPERLSHVGSSQLCGQCHSVSRFVDRDAWLDTGTPYRPGKSFENALELLHEDPHGGIDTRFWPDGVVRPNGREYNSLVRSPCFQRGELSCLSCHTMHQPVADPRPPRDWANDQLTLGKGGDGGCTQCHAELADPARLVAHTHHPAQSSGSRCYNCHMPNTAYGLQKATRSHEISNPTVAESVRAGRPNACNLCHLDRTLAWTNRLLGEWYGTAAEPLGPDQERLAAGVLWALRGDAAQRALTAWSMGWEPAQRTSGADWLGLYLAVLLDDPYDAVRSIAYRSLRTLEPFRDFRYDFMAAPRERRRASRAAVVTWAEAGGHRRSGAELLIARPGVAMEPSLYSLLAHRDERPILVVE
jgi:hypothetical protein